MVQVRDEAWITYVQDRDKIKEAIILANSLRQCLTTRTVAAVIGPGLAPSERLKIQNAFDVTFHLDNEFLYSSDMSHDLKAKLFAMSLPVFRKGVFLSTNHMVMKNLDYIFEDNFTDGKHKQDLPLMLDRPVLIFSASTSFQKRIRSMAKLSRQSENSILDMLTGYQGSYFKMDNIPDMLIAKISFQHGLLGDISGTSIVEFTDCQNTGMCLDTYIHDSENAWISYAEKKLMDLRESALHGDALSSETFNGNDFGSDPIAIVGMACRFPGAKDLTEFWNILESGLDMLTTPKEFRLNKQPWVADPDDATRETQGGFLSSPIDEFDARFFGINPKEAKYLDPQCRILHEVLWESLENSGIDPRSLRGTPTGIFTGSWRNEYSTVIENSEDCDFFREYMGNAIGAVAARLSLLLGVTGPCIATESGCSSAMVALDLAVKALRRGDCNLAIVGGVNLIVKPFTVDTIKLLFSEKCRTFDANADGYARAEGCGLLVLKRMSAALQDKDNIWALIRGTGVSQEGLSKSMGTPTVEGEVLAMTTALRDAHVVPEDISYVEAHGTGTQVGDPMEVAAITKAYFSEKRKSPLVIGSVKTNVGHTESCSGITGIIKTVLALHHKKIPRHLNLETINPGIDLSKLPAIIPLETLPWPENNDGRGRMAGVSSFAITGTDCHVIVQEAPKEHRRSSFWDLERPLHIFKITGKTQTALDELHDKFRQTFREVNKEHQFNQLEFPNAAFTANTGRADFNFREVVIAESYLDAAAKLEAGEHLSRQRDPATSKQICFLFPGQGCQYPKMGKLLYDTSPTFRFNFDLCESILRKKYDFSIFSVVWPKDSVSSTFDQQSALNRTVSSQTAIFCVEFCLFKLWESWGVKPDFVLGHSLGEFTAAVAAGILDLEGALALVVERSRLIDSLPPGNMLVIQADLKGVESLLEESQLPVDIAATNSREQTAVAGEETDVGKLKASCDMKGIKAQVLSSSHPFHSRYMDPILDKWRQVVLSVRGNISTSNEVKFISGLEGKLLDKSLVCPDYWVRHTREPVRFLAACESLRGLEVTDYLEIGPQPILSTFVSLANEGTPTCTCLPSVRRGSNDWKTMLTSLGKLYLMGYNIDWTGFDAPYQRQRVPFLPTYPFDRQPFWMTACASGSRNHYEEIHPLVGRVISNASSVRIFQKEGSCLQSAPFLRDHCIADRIVFPGAAFMEMCAAAAHFRQTGSSPKNIPAIHQTISVENFQIHSPLEMKEGEIQRIQVVVGAPEPCGKTPIQIFTQAGEMKEDGEWMLHVSSFHSPTTPPDDHTNNLLPSEVVARVHELLSSPTLPPRQFYDHANAIGLQFGETFQLITKMWCLGKLHMVTEINAPPDMEKYILHPSLIDAVIQTSIACDGELGGLFSFQLPVKVTRMTIFPTENHSTQKANNKLLVYAWKQGDVFNGYLLTSNFKPLVYLEGIAFVASTVENFLSALDERDKQLPESWEETWKPVKGPGTRHSALFPNIDTLSFPDNFSSFPDPLETSCMEKVDRLVYLHVLDLLYNQLHFKTDWLCGIEGVDTISICDRLRIPAKFSQLVHLYLTIIQEHDADFRWMEKSGCWRVNAKEHREDARAISSEIKALSENLQQTKWGYTALMLEHVVKNLPAFFQGDLDVLSILFPTENVTQEESYTAADFYKNYPPTQELWSAYKGVVETLLQKSLETNGDPEIRILEVGAGTGALTSLILPLLKKLFGDKFEYFFTDISRSFFNKAAKFTVEHKDQVNFSLFNIDRSPLEQGIPVHYFDMVIAAETVHVGRDLRKTLGMLRQTLKPKGILCVTESLTVTKPPIFLFAHVEVFCAV